MFPFHPAGLVSFCGFFGKKNWHRFGCGSSFQPLLETTKRIFFLYDTTDAAAEVANQVWRLSGQVFFFIIFLSRLVCVCALHCAVAISQGGVFFSALSSPDLT